MRSIFSISLEELRNGCTKYQKLVKPEPMKLVQVHQQEPIMSRGKEAKILPLHLVRSVLTLQAREIRRASATVMPKDWSTPGALYRLQRQVSWLVTASLMELQQLAAGGLVELMELAHGIRFWAQDVLPLFCASAKVVIPTMNTNIMVIDTGNFQPPIFFFSSLSLSDVVWVSVPDQWGTMVFARFCFRVLCKLSGFAPVPLLFLVLYSDRGIVLLLLSRFCFFRLRTSVMYWFWIIEE